MLVAIGPNNAFANHLAAATKDPAFCSRWLDDNTNGIHWQFGTCIALWLMRLAWSTTYVVNEIESL